ncbi:hypothetical protein KIPE111705_15095 [Kibdelosporangium persicum]|uniref:ESX-1 secretion-associated protein EspA/EspE-like domain-containing protein n=1 Tax=Kibdelosporangium persicum TaxID=2698649 RepID=A0ABX2FDR7_9PSEU|nr:hypothetical protein [Kibdelosporangium persicum]NRN69514.1 hypothetical protein [Kibdelosporangium persicum]
MACKRAMELVGEIEQLAQPPNILQTDVNRIRPLVRPAVARLAAGEPGAVDDLLIPLANAVYVLTQDETEGFDRARDHLAFWSGDAAENFGDWLAEAESASTLMRTAVADLKNFYDSYKRVVEACHTDLVAILEKAKGALEDVHQQETETLLTVAQVGVTFIAPQATTLELAATVAEAAVELISVGISGGGESRFSVVQSLLDALGKLDDATSERAGKMADGLVNLFAWIGKPPHVREVQPPPPQIITGQRFDPEKFRLPDSMNAPKPANDDPLVMPKQAGGPTSRISSRLAGDPSGARPSAMAN